MKEFGYLSDGDLLEVKASDLMGSAIGETEIKVANLFKKAVGKVLFIDEAYNLDPTRGTGTNESTGATARGSLGYGGEALTAMCEKMDGGEGQDLCVILAGYEPDMLHMFQNSCNMGLYRRCDADHPLRFKDFNDAELATVLKQMVVRKNMEITPSTVREVIRLVAQVSDVIVEFNDVIIEFNDVIIEFK